MHQFRDECTDVIAESHQSELTPLQVPHITNAVYKAIRAGWRRQTTHHVAAKSHGHKTRGSRPFTASSNRVTVNSEVSVAICESFGTIGLLHPFAILVEREVHDELKWEVAPDQWFAWLDATETGSRVSKLWYFRRIRQCWYPNPWFLSGAAHVGLKLTQKLLASGCIRQCTPEQHAWLLAERAKGSIA